MEILFYILALFIGYIVGRINHILGGHLPGPHHWIYGLILLMGGLFFIDNFFAILILFFGTGLFISDLKDFINLKFFGVDEVKEKKFLGID